MKIMKFGDWGIDKPVENAETRELSAVLSLDGKALATSGNYRKFYEEDGIKYSHTINPENGYSSSSQFVECFCSG